MSDYINIRKYVAIGLLLFVGICFIYFITVTLPRIGKIPVEVTVYPEDAKVYIDNNQSNKGVAYLTPGTHTFSAEKEGWQKNTLEIDISEINNSVALIPEPDSPEAYEEVNKPEVAMRREALAGIAASARGSSLRTQSPIINLLPFSDVSGPFKIDYGFNRENNNSIYILVSYSTPDGRKKAVDWLLKNKVDITTTEIIFDGFVYPFEEEDHHE